MAFEQHSDNLRRSSVWNIAQNATSCSREKKLLEGEKVARNMKSCQKAVEQLVESPSFPLIKIKTFQASRRRAQSKR